MKSKKDREKEKKRKQSILQAEVSVGSKAFTAQFRNHHPKVHWYRTAEDRTGNTEPRTVDIKNREPR